jgi:PilZ domain
MSARKLGNLGNLQQPQHVTVEARQARLTLSPETVVIHKGGIEFRSTTPFPIWVEMTVSLQSPQGTGLVRCSGVVVDCTGSKHAGYHVSMVFTGLSRQAEARLNSMAGLPPG